MKPPLVIFGHTRMPLALANTSAAPPVSAWNLVNVAFASASRAVASFAVRSARAWPDRVTPSATTAVIRPARIFRVDMVPSPPGLQWLAGQVPAQRDRGRPVGKHPAQG